jgi:hypothetical protein
MTRRRQEPEPEPEVVPTSALVEDGAPALLPEGLPLGGAAPSRLSGGLSPLAKRGLSRAALGFTTAISSCKSSRRGNLSFLAGDEIAVTSNVGAWWAGFTLTTSGEPCGEGVFEAALTTMRIVQVVASSRPQLPPTGLVPVGSGGDARGGGGGGGRPPTAAAAATTTTTVERPRKVLPPRVKQAVLATVRAQRPLPPRSSHRAPLAAATVATRSLPLSPAVALSPPPLGPPPLALGCETPRDLTPRSQSRWDAAQERRLRWVPTHAHTPTAGVPPHTHISLCAGSWLADMTAPPPCACLGAGAESRRERWRESLRKLGAARRR